MADDQKDLFRKSLGYHLLHAARMYRTVATKRLSELGLHQGQEQILILLMERGAMSLGDLASTLQVRPPTMTKSIARLEAQGFVKRKDSKSDARSTTVSLTSKGKTGRPMSPPSWLWWMMTFSVISMTRTGVACARGCGGSFGRNSTRPRSTISAYSAQVERA